MTDDEVRNEIATGADTSIAIVPIDDRATLEIEERRFELVQRQAKALASSTIVPKDYRGNIGNCIIALDLARRLRIEPLAVMQNIHVIHGKPGFSAAFLIAMFNKATDANGARLFSRMRFRFNKAKDECTAYATELATGEKLEGTTVSRAMADKEGWSKKDGSKWLSMPEQMLTYRAAAFFIRTSAPELMLGSQTLEELADSDEPAKTETAKPTLLEKLQPTEGEPNPSDAYKRHVRTVNTAPNREAVIEAAVAIDDDDSLPAQEADALSKLVRDRLTAFDD